MGSEEFSLFSSLFLCFFFFLFFPLFFAFVRFSSCSHTLLEDKGLSLQPRLHRPRAKLPGRIGMARSKKTSLGLGLLARKGFSGLRPEK